MPLWNLPFSRLRVLFFLLMADVVGGAGDAGAADASSVLYQPPGSWVRPHFFDQSQADTLDAGTDDRVILLEQQWNVPQHERFVHDVRQVVSTAGLQKDSTLTIEFAPGYETLAWHWARLWRDGQHFERLATNQVKLVQREEDLDQYLLNGRKSAVLVLDDVRVGDIIDYAYSIKGENPVFDTHFSAGVPVQIGEPAGRLYTRVLWPRNHPLYAQGHGCTVQPVVRRDTNALEYVWDIQPAAGMALEDALPGWFDPQPWVQLTDFPNWAAVNRWALGLFHSNAPLAPGLARKIAEWHQLPEPEQQILAAVRFVQDDVRYFGIEVGASAEKPADPSVVFARRYGDCKDKSWLLVNLLRGLGYAAYPVLLHSSLGRALDDWRPSAAAFDHCIVALQFEGQVYWVDPTINYQRGPLASLYLPPYERGLVVSPTTTGLTVIPPAADNAQTATTEYFQLGGKTGDGSLRVVTVARGRDADSLRAFFATTKRADIDKRYTHFYSDQYPEIRLTAPVEVQDDEAQDVFQTTENYTLGHAWTWSDQAARYRVDFYPTELADMLRKPVDTDRTMPLAVGYPRHAIYRTEVTLPEEWPADAVTKNIQDPAFTFHKSIRCGGNRLVMQYEYQSLSDAVTADAAAGYLRDLDAAKQSLGNGLSWK